MAYHLLKAPYLEEMIFAHMDVFLGHGPFSEDTLLIVQNQQTTSWLSRALAKQTSVLMGFKAFLTEEGFRRLAIHFDCVQQATQYDEKTARMQRPFLFDDDLKLLIYHELLEHKTDRQLQFVQDYLEKIPASLREARLWSLAGEIAAWFAQYARSSSTLMRAWRRNTPLANLGDKEPWQRFLWHQIFGTDAPAYNFLGDWLDRIQESQAKYQGPIKRIILVGSAFLNQVYLDFLQYLSHDVEIMHFLLQPVCDDHAQLEWPFLINHTIMTKQLSDYFALSSNTTQEVQPLEQQAHSSLQALQHVMYFGKKRETPMPLDESLQQITCSDAEREVEVLKDHLLQVLDRDPELKLNEIAVVAPNINKYAAYIEAIFERGGKSQRLAYNMIDLDDSSDPAFTQASMGLLNISGSNFTRKEIFELLDNPIIIARHHITEDERKVWLDFCVKTQILFHKNEDQRQELALGQGDLNTFDKGFRAFLIGRILGNDDFSDTMTMAYINESTAEKIGRFVAIIEKIYMDFAPLAKLKLSMSGWLDKIERLFLEHLVAPGQELGILRTTFSHLRESTLKIATLQHGDQIISFSVIKEIVGDVIKNQKRKVGRYLAHGVVCSSLIPLRALPFKIIAVLGLGHGEFPAAVCAKNSGYDLLENAYLKKQIHIYGQKNYLDRHAFLETIFSAREGLWLFYQDRDSINGDKLSPSSSLSDLQELISTTMTDAQMIEQWPQKYPKSPFASTLYTANSRYYSYDQHWYSLALASGSKEELSPENFENRQDHDNEGQIFEKYGKRTIEVHELSNFVKNPLAYFKRSILQVEKGYRYEDPVGQIDESFQLSYTEQYKLYDEFLDHLLSQKDGSWHAFLNMDISERLKTGHISNELLSRRYYLLLEDKISWMSECLAKENLPLLREEVQLHDASLGRNSFDAPLMQWDKLFCYIYGSLEQTFVCHETRTFYMFRLYENEKKAMALQYEMYLYFLLCRLIAPSYEFEPYLLNLTTKKLQRPIMPEAMHQDAKKQIAQMIEALVSAYERVPQIDTDLRDKESIILAENVVLDRYEEIFLDEFYRKLEKAINNV